MIRTRDFAVFLCLLFFLITGISATVALGVTPESGAATALVATVPDRKVGAPPEAVLVTAPPLDRTHTIATMRDAVAVALAETTPIPVPVDAAVAAPDEPVAPEVTMMACANYQAVAWPDRPGIVFTEVEGARLLVIPDKVSGTQVVLAQLPWRTHPLAEPACVPYDVIGVAHDGSLIRNNETALYSIFERDAHLGYALDGFPMYGAPEGLVLDRCGGAQYQGLYRYFVDPTRPFIIGCFSGGAPLSLP